MNSLILIYVITLIIGAFRWNEINSKAEIKIGGKDSPKASYLLSEFMKLMGLLIPVLNIFLVLGSFIEDEE